MAATFPFKALTLSVAVDPSSPAGTILLPGIQPWNFFVTQGGGPLLVYTYKGTDLPAGADLDFSFSVSARPRVSACRAEWEGKRVLSNAGSGQPATQPIGHAIAAGLSFTD